ncbi:MAG: hypothetical protein ACRDJG_02160, partial [Actinomycetota bacterium]
LMLAFGGGYTWGGALLRWTLPPPAHPESVRVVNLQDGSEEEEMADRRPNAVEVESILSEVGG